MGEVDNLRSAATALYMAGRWDCDKLQPSEQARLWEDLRDALGLDHGTATSAGVEGIAETFPVC